MIRERQRQILEYVQKSRIVSLAKLAKNHEVSEFTIRRDIDYLAENGLLVKIKGGAKAIETPLQVKEAKITHRLQTNIAEKEIIARRGIEEINPGDTLFLDGSSTIVTLARFIAKQCSDITVVTNSILISLELADAIDIRIYGLGGNFDRETLSFVGSDPNSTIATSFYVNKAFLSCAGYMPDQGTFENAMHNSQTKSTIAKNAGEVILCISSEKYGKRALSHVLRNEQIDKIITDKTPENFAPPETDNNPIFIMAT